MVAPMPRSAFVMVFAVFMAACASDPVLTSELEVSNPRDGLWQNAANAPIQFVLEQTWGVEDGEPEEMLARVGPLEVDASGNIYMLDSRAPMLISWDASGNHRWTLSAKGEGPQEFQSAWSMIFDGQSSLYVFNQSGSRIDRISSDGEFLDSFTTESLGLPRLGGIGMPSPDVIVASETLPVPNPRLLKSERCCLTDSGVRS